MDPYEELANAIIVQAADDYRAEKKRLRRLLKSEPPPDPPKEDIHPEEEEDSHPEEDKRMARKKRGPHEKWEDRVNSSNAEIASIERFFNSRRFARLTNADGALILKKLKEEAAYDSKGISEPGASA